MPFQKGKSGNPKGRPKGSINRVSEYKQQILDNIPGIVNKMIEMAQGGDFRAARVLIEMVIPKARAVTSPTPFKYNDSSLSDAGQSILQATASGNLAADQATTLLQALSNQAKLIEHDLFESRLQKLEAKMQGE